MKIITDIKAKNRVRLGKIYQGSELTGYNAEIDKDSIRLYGVENNRRSGPLHFDKYFKLGDSAEYDSYNLRYIGIIVAIGAKTITIEAYPGTHNAEKHRLSFYDFARRNYDFNLESVAEYNRIESMCI